ncbi:unnamed protein product [Vitrella brassicaformis CCMP3155]|uniref:Uncharacterized protein n=1 Tax=Vitrella brassicaformis (strain CCMP3155) TaxID=1169540 RepID=A0A0G4H5N4_VITBC|nr:unnamed protein product [Vitrella brassicaformis CCMP3155]|eukprot:CEM38974.1 unnamed protein product [Vitrella brassicaformis CCMP3155]
MRPLQHPHPAALGPATRPSAPPRGAGRMAIDGRVGWPAGRHVIGHRQQSDQDHDSGSGPLTEELLSSHHHRQWNRWMVECREERRRDSLPYRDKGYSLAGAAGASTAAAAAAAAPATGGGRGDGAKSRRWFQCGFSRLTDDAAAKADIAILCVYGSAVGLLLVHLVLLAETNPFAMDDRLREALTAVRQLQGDRQTAEKTVEWLRADHWG